MLRNVIPELRSLFYASACSLLIVGLGACGGTRYGTVEHAYLVPPEHVVAAEANTIAFTVTG